MRQSEQALYTAAQVRELDRLASARFGVPGPELMQRAAQALWLHLQALWPAVQRLLVVCGPGNNGGDGFLLALLARRHGCQVAVVALDEHSHGDAAQARQAFVADGGRIEPPAAAALPAADLIVDALFGSGLNRAPEGAARELIEAINAHPAPVLAVDLPSGLDADRGQAPGACIQATATLCMVAWKRGLFTGHGVQACGTRTLAQLDLPEALYDRQPADAMLLAPAALPARPADSHKGDFGHVLVLGGEHGYGGAARLAGEAALRCGAGLVSLGTRERHVPALLAARPEIMAHALDGEGVPPALLAAASVLVVGPGLGRQAWGERLLEQALATDLPLVLDADALNLLAGRGQAFAGRPVVLTPHPGEAARLLGGTTAAVQADRFAAVRALAERYACMVVLKGVGSLVATPDGRVRVCPWGNPGMAGGGMGDVLAGVIGALLAQGWSAPDAAAIGTGWHARAGDHAAQAGQRGLLASDLLPALRALGQADG